ncbi:MAG: carbon storage regulator [Betaproteobacteria bacterium]
MLVLSRKVGEEIVIANRITVRVTSVQGQRVRLAISAPDDVSIFRAEIQSQRLEFGSETEQLVLIGECQ